MISKLPLIDAQEIPDDALWAAVVSLGILAHAYRYEEKYDGLDGAFPNSPLLKPLGIVTADTSWCNNDISESIEEPETKVIHFLRELTRLGST
jgi:hypothetical protein